MIRQNIRFVDLNTGNTFDGSEPYIFWLDGEQSINLIYSKPICFISNNQKVNVSINNNDIFYLIDSNKIDNNQLETIYEFEYHNLNSLKSNNIVSLGTEHQSYYVHIIYIIGSAKQPGEYLEKFTIDDEEFTIGGDFYNVNESLYINLANNGIELPNAIQKAIYDTNVHEETRDDITLNRKLKELLSNLWDVIANKGTYKSLYNSLKWFEYGDRLRFCEVWKEADINRYMVKDIQKILSDKFSHTLTGFSKTTYMALYYALEKVKYNEHNKVILDEEKNPKLYHTVSRWSVKDLSLKLSLLGNFYETYFMPIHLDLIHSTIEDVVYTNTFKSICGGIYERNDFVYDCKDFICSVKNNDVFKLDFVKCQVGPKTLFRSKDTIIGVQTDFVESLYSNDDWAKFSKQLYSDIGCVVDFDVNIPLENDDKIKLETLIFRTFDNDKWKYVKVIDNKILGNKFKFQLLCPIEGEYDVRLQFDSIGGNSFVKKIKFNVIDTNNVSLNVYRIQNKQILNVNMLKTYNINNYGFVRCPTDNPDNPDTDNPLLQYSYSQYIPSKIDNLYDSGFNWKGVCLNHLLIIQGNVNSIFKNNDNDDILLQVLERYYFLMTKTVNENNIYKQYTICISRIFGLSPDYNVSIQEMYSKLKSYIYREDYIFVPEFHELVPLNTNKYDDVENIKYYLITDKDALCVIPELSWGKNIKDYSWEFVNASRPDLDPIKIKNTSEPFILDPNSKNPLPKGYYTIKFNYRLTNEDKINTIVLDSAFKKI